MIPVAVMRAAFGLLAQSVAQDEVRTLARSEAAELRRVVTELTGDRYVGKRFTKLGKKVQRQISWNALRDGLNEYRNEARRAWRAAPAKSSGKKTRRAIARGYRIQRLDSDTLAAFVSYKNGPARKANLLEWDTKKTRGKLVGTNTFESNKARMLRIIAESVAVQIRQDPENARARRQAVRARLGAA